MVNSWLTLLTQEDGSLAKELDNYVIIKQLPSVAELDKITVMRQLPETSSVSSGTGRVVKS